MSELAGKITVHRFGRRAVLMFLWALTPFDAHAATAVWTQGGNDLVTASAGRCTLDVVFTEEEVASLVEWRLTWVSGGEAGDLLRVVAGPSVQAGEACEVRDDADGDRGARIDTAYFCTGGGSLLRRHIMDIATMAPMRIAVVPVLRSLGTNRATVGEVAGGLPEWWPLTAPSTGRCRRGV